MNDIYGSLLRWRPRGSGQIPGEYLESNTVTNRSQNDCVWCLVSLLSLVGHSQTICGSTCQFISVYITCLWLFRNGYPLMRLL